MKNQITMDTKDKNSGLDKSFIPPKIEEQECKHPPEYVLLEGGYKARCLKCNKSIHFYSPKP